jgi:hypothetical protein
MAVEELQALQSNTGMYTRYTTMRNTFAWAERHVEMVPRMVAMRNFECASEVPCSTATVMARVTASHVTNVPCIPQLEVHRHTNALSVTSHASPSDQVPNSAFRVVDCISSLVQTVS